MTFNSVIFIFCALPAFLLLYAILPRLFGSRSGTAGKVLLLCASVFFYSWTAFRYLPLLTVLVIGNYLVALGISNRPKHRKPLLAFGIIADVLCLLFYKYFNFFGEQFASLFCIGFTKVAIIQPLGISFLVFSLISYLMDVYRSIIEADWNLLNVSLWASFFPKITSGPISRYSEMFPGGGSLFDGRLKLDDLYYGARRFVIGFAKKVIMADTFGVMVDAIFAAQSSTGIDAPTAWLGIILYSFQIFFDFSGYSDMAIGLAAMFGFRLKENFDYPYISKTPGEFWHRWHVSLSTWLRDYLYFPLGGNRRGNVYVNLLIVFLISGLWHGASWHYVAWGAWWALFMIVDRLYRKHAEKLRIPSAVTWLITMLVVLFGWVLFRADWMSDAAQYFATMFGMGGTSNQALAVGYYLNHRTLFLLAVAIVCSTPVIRGFAEKFEGRTWFEILRAIGLPALFVVSVLFMVNSTYSPFLYAQY